MCIVRIDCVIANTLLIIKLITIAKLGSICPGVYSTVYVVPTTPTYLSALPYTCTRTRPYETKKKVYERNRARSVHYIEVLQEENRARRRKERTENESLKATPACRMNRANERWFEGCRWCEIPFSGAGCARALWNIYRVVVQPACGRCITSHWGKRSEKRYDFSSLFICEMMMMMCD
jgi:hypothetical protein